MVAALAPTSRTRGLRGPPGDVWDDWLRPMR